MCCCVDGFAKQNNSIPRAPSCLLSPSRRHPQACNAASSRVALAGPSLGDHKGPTRPASTPPACRTGQSSPGSNHLNPMRRRSGLDSSNLSRVLPAGLFSCRPDVLPFSTLSKEIADGSYERNSIAKWAAGLAAFIYATRRLPFVPKSSAGSRETQRACEFAT